MRKNLTILIISIMVLLSLGILFCLNNNVEAQGVLKRSNVYMAGALDTNDDANLTTTPPTNSTAITEDLNGIVGISWNSIGRWVYNPMTSAMIIDGPGNFSIWASGNYDNIQFRARISNERTYDPGTPSTYDEIETNTGNLGDIPQLFNGEANITRFFQMGDELEIRLYWFADTQFGPRNGMIYYEGKKQASNLSVFCDSVEITPEWESVNYPDALITYAGRIQDAFGRDDIVNKTWSIQIISSDGTIQKSTNEYSVDYPQFGMICVYWIWDYGADKAAPDTYDVKVSAYDNSGNLWNGEFKFPLTQVASPPVDIQIDQILLSNDEPEVGEKVYINATLKAFDTNTGEAVYVDVRFYINDVAIENITVTIEIGSSLTVTSTWIAKEEGYFSVKAEADPEEYVDDEKRDNNVEELSFSVGGFQKPPGDEDKEFYEEFWDWSKDDVYYLPIIIPPLIIVIAAVGIGVRRKKKRGKVEIEETDEGYEMDK